MKLTEAAKAMKCTVAQLREQFRDGELCKRDGGLYVERGACLRLGLDAPPVEPPADNAPFALTLAAAEQRIAALEAKVSELDIVLKDACGTLSNIITAGRMELPAKPGTRQKHK